MYTSLEIEKYDKLPLLSEENKIFDLTRAYLHLPYSVAEYGCGKRADIITKQLIDLGINASAIRYGMIIEPDMSAAALAEKNHFKRAQALIARNPLAALMDFEDKVLIKKVKGIGAGLNFKKRSICLPPYYRGDYELHTDELIGFNLARSHVFIILRFFDRLRNRISHRVLDPMLDEKGMFNPSEIRARLHCTQGVLFSSEIGGYFRLMENYLTPQQREKLNTLLANRILKELDADERCQVIRQFLNNAPQGSIGDPATWTYDNNLQDKDVVYYKELTAAERRRRAKRRGPKAKYLKQAEVKKFVSDMAAWSEEKLLPLSALVNCLRVHKSEIFLHDMLLREKNCRSALADEISLNELRGFGVRLRERIDRMAEVSKNTNGEIDARIFTPRFEAAAIELIRQMNEAGLLVFTDQAGNIHGILADNETQQALLNQKTDIRDVVCKALGFHSHIDTVYDAGKYDGRLGVLSGVEIAAILYELSLLNRLYDAKLKKCPLLVSAYVNEEMTYTGCGISMPGSSVVAGTADIKDVYRMKNLAGRTFGAGLTKLLKKLVKMQKAGIIKFAHKLSASPENLPRPQQFLARQAIERHCEQADMILSAGVPLAQVKTIMGIQQEDFHIKGERAEKTALLLIDRLHALNDKRNGLFSQTRITTGSIFKSGPKKIVTPSFAKQYILKGRRDHAGSTAIENRFDPAKAAGKLSREFFKEVKRMNVKIAGDLKPVCGSFNLFAKYTNKSKTTATARNAIPDSAIVSLGISGKKANAEIWENITGNLEKKLKNYTRSGEDFKRKDLLNWQAIRITNLEISNRLLLTLDMRDISSEIINEFIDEKNKMVKSLIKSENTDIQISVEQELEPIHLDKNRNVSLILDGSIGGSHNPYEGEYPEVILSGTILQLSAALSFMDNPAQKIYDIVQNTIPRSWHGKTGDFYSGALHDACQIAAGIEKRNKAKADKPIKI
jgi:hypothetical protein